MASGARPYAPQAARGGPAVANAEEAPRERRDFGRLLDLAERNSFVAVAVATWTVLLLNRLPVTLGGDAWLALVSGRELLDSGFPRHDTLTVWSQGEPWVDQQWGAQLVLYGIHALAGVNGLLLANAILIVGSFALALGVARVLGASGRSTALLGVAAVPVLVAHTAVRAQTLAYPLLVAVTALLVAASRRGGSWRVLLVLPVLVVWANVHGSVLLGVGLVTLFALVEGTSKLRGRVTTGWPLLGVLAAGSWASVFASPYGLDLVDYYRATVANPAFTELVGEWGPPSFPAHLAFLAFAGAGTWVAARNPALSAFEKAAFAITLAAGFVAVRNVVWFALISLVVLPAAVDVLWPERGHERRRRLNVALAGVALVLVAVSVAAALTRERSTYVGAYSRSAEEALGSAVVGSDRRVFANERYADWLLWEFPELRGRVAFDARFELLDSQELRAIGRWRGRSGDNWRAAAKGYELLVLDLETERDVIVSLIGAGRAFATYTNGQLVLLVAAPREP